MAQIWDVFSNPPITRLSSFLTWADSFILEFFFKKLEKFEKKPVGQTIRQIGDITKVPASLCYFCHHICMRCLEEENLEVHSVLTKVIIIWVRDFSCWEFGENHNSDKKKISLRGGINSSVY